MCWSWNCGLYFLEFPVAYIRLVIIPSWTVQHVYILWNILCRRCCLTMTHQLKLLVGTSGIKLYIRLLVFHLTISLYMLSYNQSQPTYSKNSLKLAYLMHHADLRASRARTSHMCTRIIQTYSVMVLDIKEMLAF